jgi:small subunit ribosomal protein S20
MPHHKSAAKRVITNEKARQRNMAAKSHLRSTLKAVRSAATRPDAEKALKGAIALLDRTASRGIIKKETASRQKSRLTKFTAKLPA